MVNPYVSVDCVLLGFDGQQLNVLLVRQCKSGGLESTGNFKLSGSLIDMDEDLDDAARRVLKQLIGLSQIKMTQFKAFGSISRLKNSADSVWLELFHQLEHQVERIVPIAHLSLLRIDRKMNKLDESYEAQWLPINKLPKLTFGHKEIIENAVISVREMTQLDPTVLFRLLQRKFTAAQLHEAILQVSGKYIDLRNFHKNHPRCLTWFPWMRRKTAYSTVLPNIINSRGYNSYRYISYEKYS